MAQTTVLSPSDSSWVDFLESNDHDIHHLPRYVAAEADRLNGEPIAILVEDDARTALVPLVLRPLPGAFDAKDAISPYGYPGPLLSPHGHDDAAFVREAGFAIAATLRELSCCAAFIRCHPLLPRPEYLFEDVGECRVVGPTVWIDLLLTEEERWALMKGNTRRSIRRTIRDGYVVQVDERWDLLETFVDLYHETMDRVGAAESYYFEHRYFEQLKEALGDQAHLLAVWRDDEVVATGLFTEANGTVQWHLSAAKRLTGDLSPARVMVEYASTWFALRGNAVLHLGGGVGGLSDSLLLFKTGFSPLRGLFAVCEMVTDREIFDLACSALIQESGQSAESSHGFFPPYRRPHPTS